jgi:phosphoribosylformylglycinamidine synthase
MGGSVLYSEAGGKSVNLPKPDLKIVPKVFRAIHKGIKTKKVLSCHDISEGGLIISVFEMCAGGNLGAEIKIPNNFQSENFLFNETAGCFIVEVASVSEARNLFNDVPYLILGRTTKLEKISILQNGKLLFEDEVSSLKRTWKTPMEKIFS